MKRSILPILLIGALSAQAQQGTKKSSTPRGFGVSVVQTQPEYPGGLASLQQFLLENLQYPEAAKPIKAKGLVYVGFKVTHEGKLTDARILKSPDPTLDSEALRLISIMPDWKPGTISGSPADVQYVLSIEFVLPKEHTPVAD
ncbi:MAG: energy transducer TonB [Bacteroidota bacterium]